MVFGSLFIHPHPTSRRHPQVKLLIDGNAKRKASGVELNPQESHDKSLHQKKA